MGENLARETDNSLEVSHLTKIYKLYDKPSDRLRESLGLSRKKRSRDLYALQDVSFTVRRGETVGIIGTNGSGKSTILKIITGVLSPTAGSVSVNGRISALLELGAGFNMEYTGIENVYLNGTMMGFTREEIDERLDDILRFADIGEFVNQPCKTYSSGMFVRLAFAVAINIDPDILIVDEALSVGDVFFQAKCYHKFEEFKKQGKTILFVSHDLGSISRYCDRVVVLNKGVKRAEGGPKEMVDLYKKILVNLEDGSDKEIIVSEKKELIESYDCAETIKNDISSCKPETSGNIQVGSLRRNPNTLEYGNGSAEIIRIRILDENGLETETIRKGSEFSIEMVVRYYQSLESPIAAFTIKNLQGVDLCGTNTMIEHVSPARVVSGDLYHYIFRQRMDLQGGEYLVSFGCTGFHDGEFQVFHRLYDILSLAVISDKNSVGIYDMNARCTVKKISEDTV